ncbi:conserved hypothetical protein [Prochlorococcus marinus str. MIT 9515]|uniref:Biotin transporter n=2 Tax=Prochlorococcus marinus TaxID=1219 RepID=A2BWP3_PROM5|nr:conserved hypothetical protein [Prochlorococcus marinus str. MIT 9515]
MLNFNKIIEVLTSLQIIIISTFIPFSISLPFTNKLNQILDIPMSLQIPSIIIITLIFKREVVIISYSIYLLIGLFFLPIFQNGGSVGYILTPNFGYLLGIYPLINIINKVNKINRKIHYYDLLRYGVLGICSTHIIGIIYSSIQILYFKQPDTLIYNISKYSFGKFFYHLLMLIPITLLSKFLNIKYRNKK